MLVTADIGNTESVFGIWREKILLSVIRLPTKEIHDTKSWVNRLYHWEKELSKPDKNLTRSQFSDFVFCSVVPSVDSLIEDSIKKSGIQNIIKVTEKAKLPFEFDYESKSTLGSDRIANAAGAVSFYGENLVIVDFGTAITFCIVQNRKYKANVIAPSMRVSLNGLLANTAKLKEVELSKPKSISGKSTEEAMMAGFYYGWKGLVKEIVCEFKKQVSEKTLFIATGGISTVLDYNYEYFDIIDKNLTLRGLLAVYRYNEKLI